jgi:DNA-binding transcriptional LysR family regulator
MLNNGYKTIKNLTFRQLQVFTKIATTGTFTAAAHELYLTQPTVSMLMKKLETAVGTPLFEQIGRRMHLTHAGEELLKTCEKLFSNLERFESYLANEKNIIRGTLNFAGVSTTEYFAPLLLKQFQQRYPDVMVSMNILDRESMLHRLGNNRDDFYIIDLLPDDIEVATIPFIENPLVVVAWQGHHLATQNNISIDRLQRESFVLREPNSGTRIALKRFLLRHDIKLQVSMELSSNEALKQAVINGMGLSILSKFAIAREFNSGSLLTLDVEGFPLMQRWYIVYSKDKYMPPASAIFLRFLLEEGKHIVEQSLPEDFITETGRYSVSPPRSLSR